MAGQIGAFMGPNKILEVSHDLNNPETFAPASGMYQFRIIDADVPNKPTGTGSTNYAIVTIQNLRDWSTSSLQMCIQTYYSFNTKTWRRVGKKVAGASAYTWSDWVEV